ncbi:hypothetical protein [Bifidobacterium simiiventris]|uniref:hypothetical protein n=1 Tax=Bifidobacterium simiiventris TaxID=2834434 RepID=UPI001C598238|nr:hypothetical protein [Bifidobacterium simiiventris]MBW3077693.1 hypothetical protein [Bifidobacterium simiiventris]
MSIRTAFGYSLQTSDDGEPAKLPPILTPDEFAALTKNRYDPADLGVITTLDAVSDAIRGHCQWHVTPVLACEWTGGGEGRLLRLPALEVTGVTHVYEHDAELDPGAYEWREDGLLRRANFQCWPRGWRSVRVDYTAGYTPAAVTSLKQVAAQIAASSLAATPGVNREQAGQVSLTFNQTAPGVSGGITLLDRDKELLAPYTLTRSF